MTALRIAAVVALAAGGCVSVPRRVDVNFNTGGQRPTRQMDPDRPDNGRGAPDGGGSPNTQLPTRSPASPAGAPQTGAPAAGGDGGWRDEAAGVAGGMFLSAENGVLFYAFDTLAYPGSPVDLAARLVKADDMKGLAGATITFVLGQQVMGSALTDADGLARIGWTPARAGDYKCQAVIGGLPKGTPREVLDVRPAPLLAAARPKDAKFVVIDLDHTVVDGSFFRVLVGSPRPMADSVEVTKRIATVYSIVYLTHRPDLLTRKSKDWLYRNGYPDGPLLVSDLKQAFGDSGKFKTAKLNALRAAYSNVMIGIGDKPSDAQAYVDNGLTAYLMPGYDQKPQDMRKAAADVRRLDGRDRLNVVDGWLEIESGIFKGAGFKPSDYAARLERRANQLEEAQKNRGNARKQGGKDDD